MDDYVGQEEEEEESSLQRKGEFAAELILNSPIIL